MTEAHYVGDPIYVPNDNGITFPKITQPFGGTATYGYIKSAREQVQDEILQKMGLAIKNNDMDKALDLVELAERLKEL